jgi:hypothetical protein
LEHRDRFAQRPLVLEGVSEFVGRLRPHGSGRGVVPDGLVPPAELLQRTVLRSRRASAIRRASRAATASAIEYTSPARSPSRMRSNGTSPARSGSCGSSRDMASSAPGWGLVCDGLRPSLSPPGQPGVRLDPLPTSTGARSRSSDDFLISGSTCPPPEAFHK